jgi:hypothetical protein
LLGRAALAIGFTACLAGPRVAAEDGPILPGLDALPPTYAPPTPRSLPPATPDSEPRVPARAGTDSIRAAQPIERNSESPAERPSRDPRRARSDPFEAPTQSDGAAGIERPSAGRDGANTWRNPRPIPQTGPDPNRYREAPSRQPLEQNHPAMQRYRQGVDGAPDPRLDTRDSSLIERSYTNPRDPRGMAPGRPNARSDRPNQRWPYAQPRPGGAQQSAPKARPAIQPRALQSTRGLPPWNASGPPPRTGAPSGTQPRR